MSSRNVAPSSEPVSVPADHRDPNHPHHPGDLEHQSGGRRSVITKKRALIAAGLITIILIIVGAAIWGVALTQKNDNKASDTPETPVTANATSSATLEIHTVSINITTTIYSTTRVPLLVAPSLATSTIIVAIPRVQDTRTRPVAAKTATVTSVPNMLA